MAKKNELKEDVTYTMKDDTTVAVRVKDTVTVYIGDTPDGVVVRVYGGEEDSVMVADTYANYDDPLLKTSDDIDGERDNELQLSLE